MTRARRGTFTDLFRFTIRVWRTNLVALVIVGLLGTAIALLAAALIEGTHSMFSFTDTSLGLGISSNGFGTSVSLNRAMTLTGLITIATGAWASATMVVMLLRRLRSDRRPRLRDLGCGLRYWPWVTLVAFLLHVITTLMDLPGLYLLGRPVFYILVTFTVSLVVSTIFVFCVQEIVDARCNALTSLGASCRLVVRVGFWRVLGNYLLFGLCSLVPLSLAENLLEVARFNGLGILGAVAAQSLGSVVVAPLAVAFATVMYLLARGDRGQVEAALGPAGWRGTRSGADNTEPELAEGGEAVVEGLPSSGPPLWPTTG